MNYETVIGLEIHVELSTETKAYCGCKNEFGAEVNTNCCPVCIGLPGALPVLNQKVVEYAVRAGKAFGCKINTLSKQDRKNYFYPDTPKAYQVSQFDIPICEGGSVEFISDEEGNTKTIRLERIQMEEDAGKMLHDDASFEGTLIDFNRCGVPLIEIVSMPDLRSSKDAQMFLETLRASLVAIGVTDGKMQEGSIRCDVNVSVMPEGSDVKGTRVEMKNVNTFSGAARAIEYESQRQIDLIESGGKVEQETRRWDDVAGQNFTLRTKEDAHDYRYFPEPDLSVICVTDDIMEIATKNMPELPHYKTLRFMKQYDLPLFDANLLIENPEKGKLFVDCVSLGNIDNKAVSNWVLGDVSRFLNDKNMHLEDSKLTAQNLFDMIAMIESGKISGAAGKTVMEVILFEDKTPSQVVDEKGLAQISDTSELENIAKSVLDNNQEAVEQYKNGKTNVLGFLVGQSMKASKGKGNPAILKDILVELINK